MTSLFCSKNRNKHPQPPGGRGTFNRKVLGPQKPTNDLQTLNMNFVAADAITMVSRDVQRCTKPSNRDEVRFLTWLVTTPGHNTCGFLRKVQNHVYERQTASGCDPHSPGGLVGWTRAFCKPPRKKMGVGQANCPQPITIQLPPPNGSKPAQMRII